MQNNIFKKINPTTSSQRSLKLLRKPKLWPNKFIKSKTFYISKSIGRNHSGCITMYQRGGGHKQLYRSLDLSRSNSLGIVQGLEYDPYRNTYIARIFDNVNRKFYYILAPRHLLAGSFISSGLQAEIKIGHALPFSKIPVGTLIHNISTFVKKKGQLARSAGMYALLIQKTNKFARIRLSSGEQRLVPSNAVATLGIVSNENLKLTTKGKAGRCRWYGSRPHVRGVAMNPIDHPHGGGEGKTSGGRPSVTPWGKPAKGPRTSRSFNRKIIVPRSR